MGQLKQFVIAVEGPCCAGKTTLSNGVLKLLGQADFAYIKDYSDFVGGGRFLPSPVPSHMYEEQCALARFLQIEKMRLKDAISTESKRLWIDRSIHTILAHSYSLEKIKKEKYYDLAVDMIYDSEVPMWPHIIYYLDIPNKVAKSRNKGKFSEGSIFLDREFNEGIKIYFQKAQREENIRIHWIDATLDQRRLRDMVYDRINLDLLG